MGWDATLTDDRGHIEGEWNYTHNTGRMICAALESTGFDLYGKSWWQHLSGMTGAEGAKFITRILDEMASDEGKYEAMDPENGWGSYRTLRPVLDEMRRSVPEWPCLWSVWG